MRTNTVRPSPLAIIPHAFIRLQNTNDNNEMKLALAHAQGADFSLSVSHSLSRVFPLPSPQSSTIFSTGAWGEPMPVSTDVPRLPSRMTRTYLRVRARDTRVYLQSPRLTVNDELISVQSHVVRQLERTHGMACKIKLAHVTGVFTTGWREKLPDQQIQ